MIDALTGFMKCFVMTIDLNRHRYSADLQLYQSAAPDLRLVA
ncbi:MAG: hypothetical protein ACJAUW_001783 [Yoonia sp.]|jgi:hypothetical protein